MLKNFLLISSLVFLTGCGTSLGGLWTDFKAYHNSYYNAKKSFQSGLNKVNNQPASFDPARPVRVHLPPPGAGGPDFQSAIEKGAHILRKYPGSKWVDGTLELIGKSFYYQREYYSALGKFEEQYHAARTDEMRQRAVLWKGRTLIELGQYEEGISYMESHLFSEDENWDLERYGRANVLLAELYAGSEEWQASVEILSGILAYLGKGPFKARSYFLFGQMLEKTGRHGEAYYAYSNVAPNHPEHEYVFWAGRYRARTAVELGNYSIALGILESMKRDDKNYEWRFELDYEIAKILEREDRTDEAEAMYKRLMGNSRKWLPSHIQSDIYFRLGRMYSEERNNYRMASAYFDSASSISTPEKNGFQADSYGRLTELKRQVSEADSLLWLATLSDSELDSVVEIERQRRMSERENRQTQENLNRGRILNELSSTSSGEESMEPGNRYGFLNHKDQQLAAQARNRFRTFWGARPLVDNWRQLSAIRDRGTERTVRPAVDPEEENSSLVEVDISRIPFSEDEKQKLRDRKGTLVYEIGSVFMLSLEEPDSAAFYFEKVIGGFPGHSLVPQAIYALYQVFSQSGNRQEAGYWRDQLITEFPESHFAARLDNESEGSARETDTPVSANILNRYREIVEGETDPINRAEELRDLSKRHRENSRASPIHYRAVELYIDAAREASDPEQYQQFWLAGAGGDEAAARLPARRFGDPFEGVYWDSVRILLDEHLRLFAGSPSLKRIEEIKAIIAESSEDGGIGELPGCEELNLEPAVEPSREWFLEQLNYPSSLRNMTLSGKVEYEFVIDREGNVESYKRVSRNTGLGVEEAFEEAIELYLKFYPFSMSGEYTSVRCRVVFPIQN